MRNFISKIFVFIVIVGLLFWAVQRDLKNIDNTASVKKQINNIEALNEMPIDDVSGLIIAPGFSLVEKNCLGCHSGKLISQNRGNKQTWTSVIRWMQDTQNLWDLGDNEEKIIDYLSKNYAPESSGRRKPLSEVKWYNVEK